MEHYLREMMTGVFTTEQRRALATRQADQDRTIEAVRQLSGALIAAASNRHAVWCRNVADALEVLDEALTAESDARARSDGLLSDIARTQPRLRNRVRGLRREYARLGEQIRDVLRTVIDDAEAGVAETRRRAGGLIGALHLLQGRESDLIYEAYFDAFNRDIEEELWAGGAVDPENRLH